MSIRLKTATIIGAKLAEKTGRDSTKITYSLWGIFTIVLTIVMLATIKMIAALFGFNLPIFSVYVAFNILRCFLGGFHLQNTRVCLFSTVLLMSAASFVLNFINIGLPVIFISYTIGFAVIYVIGVIDCKEKRFKESRKVVYRKLGLALTIVLLAGSLLLYHYNYILISKAVVMGAALEYVNLFLSSLLNKNE